MPIADQQFDFKLTQDGPFDKAVSDAQDLREPDIAMMPTMQSRDGRLQPNGTGPLAAFARCWAAKNTAHQDDGGDGRDDA